jgi:hypothetical protein
MKDVDDGFDLIEKVTDMFALRTVEREYTTLAFEGLLAPTESYVISYGKAALVVTGRVWKHPKEKDENLAYEFHGSFSSIDDSGMTFFGPKEGEDGATKRYHAFEAFIRESHPMMPTLEQVKLWGIRNGVHPDLW